MYELVGVSVLSNDSCIALISHVYHQLHGPILVTIDHATYSPPNKSFIGDPKHGLLKATKRGVFYTNGPTKGGSAAQGRNQMCRLFVAAPAPADSRINADRTINDEL